MTGKGKLALGAYGERVAATHLESAGMTIIDRNWRCAEGEIDIVAMDGATVVMCEVKTRSGTGYGTGFEAVTREKMARLRRLGQMWLAGHGPRGAVLRFDVVAVHRARRGGPAVEHLRGAF